MIDPRFQNPDPEDLENSLAYRFDQGAVFLDLDRGEIRFENCHLPRRFVAKADPSFHCRIHELKALHVDRDEGLALLVIVTPSGRAVIPDGHDQFTQLRESLMELVPYNQPGYAISDPATGFACFGGAVIGFALGIYLTPDRSTDATMAAYVIGGAFLGYFGPFLLVFLGDRLGIGLAKPIAFGMAGALLGFAIHFLRHGGEIGGGTEAITYCLIGCGLGVLGGFWKQSREQQPRSAKRRWDWR